MLAYPPAIDFLNTQHKRFEYLKISEQLSFLETDIAKSSIVII